MKAINTENAEILIVDDLADNIKVLGNILKINQYRISIAQSGREALEYLAKKLPDLILLDVNMPGMNGFELCERLKAEERTSAIPVIFLTANVSQEDIVIGFEVGGEDYLVKPFNPNELLARIQSHLELKLSRDIIAAQNKELIELNASKNKFFSLIAHDIRNPVTSIYGFADLLKQSQQEMSAQELAESIDYLHHSARNLKDLIEHLLEWAKMQMRKTEFSPETIIFKEVIIPVLKFLDIQAWSKKITIQETSQPDQKIYADANMLRTILINLISNAIKFTSENGVISIEFSTNANEKIIRVIDNGMGMDEKTMAKLFVLGEQHTSLGTANEKGTGLGLLLVKDFMDRHKGKVEVQSELGKGSVFTLTFPQF
jgi:signal transduction histidine kinase